MRNAVLRIAHILVVYFCVVEDMVDRVRKYNFFRLNDFEMHCA